MKKFIRIKNERINLEKITKYEKYMDFYNHPCIGIQFGGDYIFFEFDNEIERNDVVEFLDEILVDDILQDQLDGTFTNNENN